MGTFRKSEATPSAKDSLGRIHGVGWGGAMPFSHQNIRSDPKTILSPGMFTQEKGKGAIGKRASASCCFVFSLSSR